MWKGIAKALLLPQEISAFERQYLGRVNRLTVQFFLAHVPVFVLIAWFNDTGPLTAFVLTTVVAVGPVVAYRWLDNPRTVGVVYGFTSMLMGGVLVHVGQGPVQIEMHFYFFALLAMLALYGNPMAILTAAVTVAVHHLLLWMFLPASVFNYDAPWWVVAVHAAFVVLESVATIYIARSFFDSVIGLEKVVQERTTALEDRNRAMRLVLDNVEEGLLTIDGDGRILGEYSAAVGQWFGEPTEGEPLEDFLARCDEHFALEFAACWEQYLDDFLPAELTLAQAPKRMVYRDRHYQFAYRQLHAAAEGPSGLLVIISDMTAQVERDRLERESRDVMTALDRAATDRAALIEFLSEAEGLLECLAEPGQSYSVAKRALHTLKGNSMVFGLKTVADRCHELEAYMLVENATLTTAQTRDLHTTWATLRTRLHSLMGDAVTTQIAVDDDDHARLLVASVEKHDHEVIAQLVTNLKLEPTAVRLERIAGQARSVASRLGKGELDITIEASNLFLDPERWGSFWSSFIHVVRNCVDHGLERPETRRELGKATHGRLELATRLEGQSFVIEIADDGAGIDWDRVRDKAKELGLPHADRAELEEALFGDGLTTATIATEFSGRGIGLGAVRQECRARRGSMEIRSTPGRGTCFRFRFPKESMAPSPEEMAESMQVARCA